MDAVLRENFVERVFVYHRWQSLCRGRPGAGELVDFHTRHKFIVLAHDEPAYRELGRLVAVKLRAVTVASGGTLRFDGTDLAGEDCISQGFKRVRGRRHDNNWPA